LEAAKAFTDALEFIELHTDHTDITSNTSSASSSLNKQIITLINNRSAMYEKGKFPELALEDCNKILEVYDRAHTKARTRKLRILEDFDQNYNALVEVCALQLLYMQQNRETLRMGIQPASPPPVPQSKLEDFIVKLVPEQLALWEAKLEEKKKLADTLPSDYTLLQLLKSYTGYNSWMAKAARDGNMDKIDKELLDALPQDDNDDSPTAKADQASILLKKGRRHVYQGQYQDARLTLLKAFELVDGKPDVYNLMKDDAYARLLEWTGMVKHWTYDLDGATECYQQCADLEPINVSNSKAQIRNLLVAWWIRILDDFSVSQSCWSHVNLFFVVFCRPKFLSNKQALPWMAESTRTHWHFSKRHWGLIQIQWMPSCTEPICACCNKSYQRPRTIWNVVSNFAPIMFWLICDLLLYLHL
jgi:hypothetical protein